MALEKLSTPFRPKWESINGPSDNVPLAGTPAQRVFSPAAGVHVDNEFLGEPEIVLAGYEEGRTSVKVYQPEVDRYSRAFIPRNFLVRSGGDEAGPYLYQGIGADGGLLAMAGGSTKVEGSTGFGKQPSKRVVVMDAETKKSEALPEMQAGRVYPIVAVSPDARYVLVAGGYGRHDGGYVETLKSVEIYDRDEQAWIDVEARFPGLSELPAPRCGGSAAWLKGNDGSDQIVFAGGSGKWRSTLGGSDPTQRIDMYTCRASGRGDDPVQQQGQGQGQGVVTHWQEGELVTPRMLPAIAKRPLPDGSEQVIIAGGGTGQTSYSGSADPQIYSVELFNPKTGAVSLGQHLPTQPGIRIGTDNRGAVDWGANALIFATGRPEVCAATTAATTGYLFGFSTAFKAGFGAPLKEDEPKQG